MKPRKEKKSAFELLMIKKLKSSKKINWMYTPEKKY